MIPVRPGALRFTVLAVASAKPRLPAWTSGMPVAFAVIVYVFFASVVVFIVYCLVKGLRDPTARSLSKDDIRARERAWAEVVAPARWPAINPPARARALQAVQSPPAPVADGRAFEVVEAAGQPPAPREGTGSVGAGSPSCTPPGETPPGPAGEPDKAAATSQVDADPNTGAGSDDPGPEVEAASLPDEQAPLGSQADPGEGAIGPHRAAPPSSPTPGGVPGQDVAANEAASSLGSPAAAPALDSSRDAGVSAAGLPGTSPEVRVLGSVEVSGWRQDPERRVTTELVVYLALHCERARSADEVRGALWPVDADGGGRDVSAATLHQHLSRLRRCLGPEHLPEAEAGRYRLVDVRCDWVRFYALAQGSRRAGASEAVAALSEALGLVRGTPFAGAGDRYDWAWTELLVSQMSGAITAAAHQLASLALASGDASLAAWAAERGLAALPTEEVLHEDRMAAAVLGADRGSFERAWRDAVVALGLQAEQGPLCVAHRRLKLELGNRLSASG